MKNLLLLLLLLPALAAAKVPDEEDIQNKTMDAESPFYYPSLMMRYNAGDETLTDEDYHYLYYGYAYQESYKPLDSNPDLDKLLLMASGLDPDKPAVETLEAMLYTGEDALARDPFSPKILNLMAYAHGALGNKLQEKMYYNRMQGVIRAIRESGDALTQKTPRHILMFGHRRAFVRQEPHHQPNGGVHPADRTLHGGGQEAQGTLLRLRTHILEQTRRLYL